MKLFLKILAGVAVFLVVALIGVNLLISADAVRDRIAARVKEQSGRDLKVNGSTSLLFLPNPHIVLSDATITDPEARAGTSDLSIARLELDLGFLQLLSRQVDARRVVMVRPVLIVRLKPDAAALEPVSAPEKEAVPERRGEAAPVVHANKFAAAEMAGSMRRDIRLEDVRIEDGTVRIVYDNVGNERRIEHIDANLSLPHSTDPLTAHGEFKWKDEPTGFDLTLTTPADLGQQHAARLELSLKMQAIEATFDGNVTTRPSFSADGELNAKSQSIPSLLAWLKEKPTSATAIGSGELASHVAWKDDTITFGQIRFALSHATGQGQAVVALKSPRPHVRAALALDRLDLSPFLDGASGHLAIAGAEAGKPPPAPDAGASHPEGDAAPPQARLETPAPEPGPQSAPLAAPANFDADVNVNVRQTQVAHLTVGPSALGFTFHDGVLVATLGSMELYDGHGSGTLTLDVSKPVASFTSDFALDGVSAEPLLKDAAAFSLLEGHAKVSLQLSGAGTTAAAVTSSLAGKASLAMSDGAIKGIDLTAFINAIGSGQIPNLQQGPDAKTAFSDLSGSFTIASGLAETSNLQVTSPLLQVTARGTVDIVTGSIDFLTQPQIVAGPQGKGGANDLAGLSVPVRVEGPFAHPTFKPEIKGMFANPGQASKTVKQLGDVIQKKFKGKPVGEAIGRLLGSVRIGPHGGEQGTEDGAPENAPPPSSKAQPKAGAAPQQGSEEPDEEPSDPDVDRILR
jgi:AsmA protein